MRDMPSTFLSGPYTRISPSRYSSRSRSGIPGLPSRIPIPARLATAMKVWNMRRLIQPASSADHHLGQDVLVHARRPEVIGRADLAQVGHHGVGGLGAVETESCDVHLCVRVDRKSVV